VEQRKTPPDNGGVFRFSGGASLTSAARVALGAAKGIGDTVPRPEDGIDGVLRWSARPARRSLALAPSVWGLWYGNAEGNRHGRVAGSGPWGRTPRARRARSSIRCPSYRRCRIQATTAALVPRGRSNVLTGMISVSP